MKDCELYIGATIIVDYKAQSNQNIIDYFEEASMFEGWATLGTIDKFIDEFSIKEMPDVKLPLSCLICMNMETQEFEYYK